jgi:hypothetical protein
MNWVPVKLSTGSLRRTVYSNRALPARKGCGIARKVAAMAKERAAKCVWCGGDGHARETAEKSDYGSIVVRRCADCGKILASYLDEGREVLQKVRSFPSRRLER